MHRVLVCDAKGGNSYYSQLMHGGKKDEIQL